MNKYDLNQQEFDECLKKAELQVFLRSKGVEEGSQPYSVFVVGQPGAGKTSLRAYVESEYIEEGIECPFIEFNPDEIALYHKYYREIQKEYPNESYQLLQKFVYPALETYLRPKALQLRNNVIQEGTMFNKDSYLKMIDLQKNGEKTESPMPELDGRGSKKMAKGYFIDINIMAVHRFESLLSCYEREYKNIEDGLTPRAVTAYNHDNSYYKALETIQEIEKRGLYDRIRVFKRGKEMFKPQMVYCVESATLPMSNIKQVIENQREMNKQQILEDADTYLDRICILKDKVKEIGNTVLLDKIEVLENEFLTELEQFNKRKEEGR